MISTAAMVCSFGQTAESTQVNGMLARWTAGVCTHGLAGGNTKDNTVMERRKDKGFSLGLMAEAMQEDGRTEFLIVSSMDFVILHVYVLSFVQNWGWLKL